MRVSMTVPNLENDVPRPRLGKRRTVVPTHRDTSLTISCVDQVARGVTRLQVPRRFKSRSVPNRVRKIAFAAGREAAPRNRIATPPADRPSTPACPCSDTPAFPDITPTPDGTVAQLEACFAA